MNISGAQAPASRGEAWSKNDRSRIWSEKKRPKQATDRRRVTQTDSSPHSDSQKDGFDDRAGALDRADEQERKRHDRMATRKTSPLWKDVAIEDPVWDDLEWVEMIIIENLKLPSFYKYVLEIVPKGRGQGKWPISTAEAEQERQFWESVRQLEEIGRYFKDKTYSIIIFLVPQVAMSVDPQKAARKMTVILPGIETAGQMMRNFGSQIDRIKETLRASEVRGTQGWDNSDEIVKRILADIKAAFLTCTFNMPMIFRAPCAAVWDDPLPQWPTGPPGPRPRRSVAVRANRMLASSGSHKKEKEKGDVLEGGIGRVKKEGTGNFDGQSKRKSSVKKVVKSGRRSSTRRRKTAGHG